MSLPISFRKEKLHSAVINPLKAYGTDMFCNMLKVISHYKSLNISQTEFEVLKLLLLTNVDNSLKQSLTNTELFSNLKSQFRESLLNLCSSKDSRSQGQSRYDDLVMSLTLIKDLGTRLEACMSQQAEASSMLTNLLKTIL